MVAYKIVCNDKRTEVYNLLLELWQTPERECIAQCIYTDNPKVDSSFILQAFEDTRPDGNLDVLQILLDIFHAKSRITKELSKSHPDRKAATADLTSIFGKLHHYNSYPKLSDLKMVFEEWCAKYSTVHAQLSYSTEQKILLLGISIL